MKTAIIIPSYKSQETISHCLDKVVSEVKNWENVEVIVVHSGLKGLPDGLEKAFPKVRFIVKNNRLFPGEARNIGCKSTNAQLLLFTDADCLVDKGWFNAHLNAHIRGAEIATGPVRIGPRNNPKGWPEFLTQFVYFRRQSFGRPIVAAPTCNFSIRRKILKEVSYFPNIETGEDLLLNLRIKSHQIADIHFADKAVIYHLCRSDSSQYLEHRKQLGLGLGRLTKIAEDENLFNRQISLEYKFLKLICRSPFGVLLVGSKLFRLIVCILRGEVDVFQKTLLYFPSIIKGLFQEAYYCRVSYLNASKNGK